MCVCEAFESATVKLVDSASKWGLTISVHKVKGMVIGRHLADSLLVQLDKGPVEIVKSFTYLGSNITDFRQVSEEVKCHINKAARAFCCLREAIFQNHHISVETKQKVYRAAVLSVLLYGAEMCVMIVTAVYRCLTNFLREGCIFYGWTC